jgi:FkbM family methyltransferase
VYAFDPTPESLDWIRHQRIPSALIVHDYGIAAFDGIATFYPPENDQHVSHTVLPRSATEHRAINVPVKKLSTIMQTLGHECIDLLKMDIEGAEYEVIADIMSSGIRPRQLLVEFHHRFPGVSIRDTRKAVSMLRDCGYAVFWISPSNEEYGFVYTNGR